MKIYPANLHRLPDVAVVCRSWQAAAMFDAMAEPDENWRVFQFQAKWRRGASYGYVDTRQGDCIRGALVDQEAVVWGYNEGSPLSQPPATRVAEQALGPTGPIPERLRRFLQEPELDCGGTTFCIWCTSADGWRTLEVMHSSTDSKTFPFEFLEMLIGDPGPLCQWVREYYERDDLDGLIAQLYQHVPLSTSMVGMVNSQRSVDLVVEQARIIGYPVAA